MALLAAAALVSCEKKADVVSFKINNQLTPEEKNKGVLSPGIMWKFGQVSDPQLSPDGKQAVYCVRHYNLEENKGVSNLYLIASNGESEVQKLTDENGSDTNPRWSADGNSIRFISNRAGSSQIFEIALNTKERKIHQVSDIEGGITNFEFSPKEDMVLYTKEVKVDKTPEDIYPNLKHANVRIITDLMYRHWDTWEDGRYSHIFVSGFAFGRLVGEKDINAGEAFDTPMAPYYDISDLCWSANGKSVYYSSKKLTGKAYALSTNSDIYRYDIETGTTENLTAQNKGYDRTPVVSPNGQKLAWLSMETDGYESDKNRLMVLEVETGRVDEVTKNSDPGAETMCWSADGNTLYFISGQRATYQVFKYANGEVTQLTKGAHDYTSLVSKGEVLIGRKMTMSMAPELFSINTTEGGDKQITTTNRHLYENLRMGKVQERWVKTTDGREMLTWVIFPPNFDSTSTTKYPALLYCQGGPQQAVSQFWSSRWNMQLIAAQGYIVVAPNRRGTPTFNRAWLTQISGDYAGQNINDYYSAIDAVKKEPYVDANRLGALGASYGAYSIYYMAGTHNKRFKAFSAHCGMFNLESMYGTTEEKFFVNYDLGGAYWERGDKISRTYDKSPHNLVQNWNTPILITVGEHDYRIPYTESLQAFDAAQLRGVPSKLLFFPTETHFVSSPQNAVLWHRELFDWFATYLQQ